MWYMYASVAKADTSVGCGERHVGTGLHIHTVEHGPAQKTPGVFQSLLTPEITDGIAADVDRALLWFMARTGIIRSARVGFECVGKHIEARIRSCHGWQRHRIQWVDDCERGPQVAV